MSKSIKTRFAPSPTGPLHVGAARTALFNWAYAQKMGGECLLRFEDTDKSRSKHEYEEDIREGLAWLLLSFPEEHKQSEQGAHYKKAIETLLENDLAYESKEEKTEGKQGSVIRFKNPGETITFTDLVRGEITQDTKDLSDFVIAKDIETPLYHLAVVVDDMDMGITHVIRGDDGISNTPRQILLQKALGAKTPEYAHLPLILAPDKSKLSKRHGAQSVLEYKKLGYYASSLINYLALLGWNPKDDTELFTLDEFVKLFSLEGINKGGAVFSLEKLNWINREYLKKEEDTKQKVVAYLEKEHEDIDKKYVDKLADYFLERITHFAEISQMIHAGEIEYISSSPKYDAEKLKSPKGKASEKEIKEHLLYISQSIEKLDDYTPEKIKDALWEYATEHGRGEVLWPLRYALTGMDKSPDPFYVAWLLGKEETQKRITYATELLG